MDKSNESAPTKKPKADRKKIIIGGALTSLLASVIMFALTLLFIGTRFDPRVQSGDYLPGQNLAAMATNAADNIAIATNVFIVSFFVLWIAVTAFCLIMRKTENPENPENPAKRRTVNIGKK